MINKLICHFINKQKLVKMFISSRRYLISGNYVFDETMNYIRLDNNEIFERSTQLFNNGYLVITHGKKNVISKNILNTIFKVYFNRKLKITSEISSLSSFSGSVFLPGVSGRGWNVFDLSNKKVLRVQLCKEDFENRIKNYNIFNKYFLIPELTIVNSDEQCTIEEFIEYKNHNLWLNSEYRYVLNDIFDKYNFYIREIIDTKKIKFEAPLDFFDSLDTSNEALDCIINKIDNRLLNSRFPHIRVHGDLWSSNILIDSDKKIYYIDWEESKEMIFFYDIFCFIWTEVHTKNNYYLLKEYIKGTFDNYFNEMFLNINLKYDKDDKFSYFNLFFLYYFKDRWIDDLNQDNILNVYNDFLLNYKSLEKKYTRS